jgi:type III restriction enzyme
MQKFIKGSKEDGLPIMPLVIGVTQRRNGSRNLWLIRRPTIQKVVVTPEEVRKSGLLRDRIIIHFPDIAIGADMTMFKEAVANWKKKCERWAAYCDREEIKKPCSVLFLLFRLRTKRA